MEKIIVAVDAMGGDNAPRAVIEGAVDAANEYDMHIVLVGDSAKIPRYLKHHKYPSEKLTIQHASQSVDMGEAAAVSFRKKRDSSIAVGLNMVKEKRAHVFVSAGNTGACVAASTIKLRLLDLVERPGIAITFPTLKNSVTMLDVGANIDTKAVNLFQYAIMGSSYAHYVLNKTKPTVGLLNIGEEESKGTEHIKEARDMIKKTNLNFIGNIEAREIYRGNCDVVVCDGFVGNIVLKVTEGFAQASTELLKRELNRHIIPKIGALLSMSAYKALKKKMDYAEYGGAPLLGVDGAVIISHGSSNAFAIKNAIRVAGEYVRHKVNKHIVDELNKYNFKL